MKSFRQLISIALLTVSLSLSAQTYAPDTISENVTWTKTGSPYIISNSLIIQPEGYLTLEAGTVVMFRYHPDPAKKSYIKVDGALWSLGDPSDSVVFTSERDDSMGDLNGDSTFSIPRPGDWGYIQFSGPEIVTETAFLQYTTFRYGGGRNPDTITSPELYPMVTFRDETATDDQLAVIDYCDFSYSKGAAIRMGCARIRSSRITNSAHGILLTSSNCGLSQTTVQGHTGYPILFNGLKMTVDYKDSEDENFFIEKFEGNLLDNNGHNYFALGGDVVVVEGDVTPGPMNYYLDWRKLSIPYLVTDPLRIHGLDVYMEEGTLVKFKYYTENIRKPYIFLDSVCTFYVHNWDDTEPAVFTSEYDHRYDYEPYFGNDRDPMAGDWGYIEGSNFDIDDCVFKYGGLYSDPSTGNAIPDSSAVLRIRAGVSGSAQLDNCLFNSLYRHGIMFLFKPTDSYQSTIHNSSFLLSKSHYGIKNVEPQRATELVIDATNNYWYGKQGPFNPTSNPNGNGCWIDDNITFNPFEEESDDVLELVSSVLMDTVKNLDGEKIPNALVKLIGKKERNVYSKSDGSYYISNVYPGYGYTLHTFAPLHHDTAYENIEIQRDTTRRIDIHLRKWTIDYLVDTITFNVNPDISEIQARGTAHRYYKIVDRITRDPVYGAEVFVDKLVDTFYTNYKGIASISIPWDKVSTSSSGTNFSIMQVGAESLPYPPDQRMNFRVKRYPRDYTKMWGGKLWLKEGISIIELKQEVGASIGVMVEDHGTGEQPVNLLLERGFQAGGGINLGASAKATLGPIEAGAEAEIGVNLNALMKDQFIFDYANNDGRIALAKFIVLAGSAFQFLDSPLHRYLGVALLDNNPYVQLASYSNSIGLNYHGYAGAEAGLGLTLKESDGKESPIGAELKGSAEAQGDIDFLFTSYTRSPQLDFELSYAAEIGLGVSAGVGFDLNTPHLQTTIL